MASKGKGLKPKDLGVHGMTRAQKDAWARIAPRATVPTRYPHELPLTTLGILEDFWHLCQVEEDEGLSFVFQGRWPSYRRLTLEFLSTLSVDRVSRSRYPKMIHFRLNNEDYTLTMEELGDIFHCHGPDDGPSDVSHDDIWKAITIRNENFRSGQAKSTSIRNPVLRYLHRAMTQTIFARVDGGGVSQVELEVIECLLLKQRVNLGVLWTNYVDRISKTDGVICCGGLITCLAEYLEVSTEGLVPDIGEMRITYEALFAMEVLRIDDSGQGFFIQKAEDHFPVPNPLLTRVEVWRNQANYKLIQPIHRRCILATPKQGDFRKRNVPRLTAQYVDVEPNLNVDLAVYEAPDDDEDAGHFETAEGEAEEAEEEEPEVEHHRRRNRSRARRPKPMSQDEFQRDVTAQLGTMYDFMQSQASTGDTRWGMQQEENIYNRVQWEAQHAENAFNRQQWEAYGNWQTVEQGFWESQRLLDVQQRQQVEALERRIQSLQTEHQASAEDITYLVHGMEHLNTVFPPPPPHE